MAPRTSTADADREAVVLSIEAVAANLSKQVADLQRFVAQLRLHEDPDPLTVVLNININGKG